LEGAKVDEEKNDLLPACFLWPALLFGFHRDLKA